MLVSVPLVVVVCIVDSHLYPDSMGCFVVLEISFEKETSVGLVVHCLALTCYVIVAFCVVVFHGEAV